MPFTFEKLLVYQNIVDFADKIAALTGTFPSGYYSRAVILGPQALMKAFVLLAPASKRKRGSLTSWMRNSKSAR
jgi:hypothetical protein